MITCPHCGHSINLQLSVVTKQQQLLGEIEMVERILESGATWEYKFDRIFGMSKGIRALIDGLNISFSWSDPDTTYEEDVTAYVEALRGLRDNLIKEIASTKLCWVYLQEHKGAVAKTAEQRRSRKG
jgi:hypothetical protein